MMTQPVTLHQLARLFGIQTAYRDITGRRQSADPEALMAALRVLGAQLTRAEGANDAWRQRASQLWDQLAEPVLVAWDGHPAAAHLRLLPGDTRVEVELQPEDDAPRRFSVGVEDLPWIQSVEIDGGRRDLRALPLPRDIRPGYHQLRLKAGARRQHSLIIAAPPRAYGGQADERLWGVFAPIYALRSKPDHGSGDYTQLQQLSQWIASLGGGVVATLPFCCAFLDTLYAPSPYSPASRLFWNELYVDPRRAPDLARCPEATSMLDQLDHQEAQPALVDYRTAWALKRRVLQPLSESFFASSPSPAAMQRYLESHPAAPDYARFRAVTERRGSPWHTWPDAECRELAAGSWDADVERFHLYVQWLAEQQIDALATQARRHGPGLYVDLPLGVHDCGYDAWRHRDLFPLQIDVGAPPDSLFAEGQKWGFPPLHPQRMREDRYRHVIDYLSHITRKAGILRVDHVMGLHRLFWIPKGMEVKRGAYVRYPAEELYAILCLESHRGRCLIVGENLGTVPTYVNRAMRRHNIHGMYVLQYLLGGDRLPAPPEACVANLNTHDMPPFAGFWRGCDIDDRRDLGLITAASTTREHAERRTLRKRLVAALRDRGLLTDDEDEAAVLAACLAHLGTSRARMVLVNMEDLWLETRPQNIPGVSDDRRPTWRRRLRLTLDQAEHSTELEQMLRELHRQRQGPHGV